MPSKKKVMIAITQSNFGGAQRYVFDLARSLPKERFHVAVVCGGDGVLIQKLQHEHIRTISLPALKRDMSFIDDLKTFFELYRVLKSERPDVLHTNSSKMGGIGVIAGVFTQTKVVFTSHGWEFNAPRSTWQKFLIRIVSNVIVMLSYRTIAVSNSLKKQMPFFAHKIVVIPNGVEIPHFFTREEARATLSKKARISPDGFWIGTIAELHPVKGLAFSLEAFSDSKLNAQYLIIGEGRERTKLEQTIASKGISETAHVIGFVDNAIEYLKAFDLFVLPSLSEGLSYATIEAGAAGLPVIASRIGGIPEIISSDDCGMLVTPKDTSALAHAMQELAASKSARDSLGEKLFERIKNDFSLSRMVEKTIAVYNT